MSMSTWVLALYYSPDKLEVINTSTAGSGDLGVNGTHILWTK